MNLLIDMIRIGLISDTHGFLDEAVFKHFESCDEVWHAGDFGNDVAKRLKKKRRLRGVFGNIDEQEIRSEFPEQIVFDCEDVGQPQAALVRVAEVLDRGIGELLRQRTAKVAALCLMPFHWR